MKRLNKIKKDKLLPEKLLKMFQPYLNLTKNDDTLTSNPSIVTIDESNPVISEGIEQKYLDEKNHKEISNFQVC